MDGAVGSSGLHSRPMECPRISYTTRPWAAFATVLLMAGPALAQWQWRDDAGRQVFSDHPPPASVPESAIVARPKAADRPLLSEPKVTPPSPLPIGNGRASARLPRPDADATAEVELQKKVKAEQERMAAERADNCQRARRALITINSGMRMATVNDRGEREFLDEKALASERQRIEAVIRSDCAPG